MVVRSMPERTVDAWVSAAIFGAFPAARIWAPTQNDLGSNWDYGADLGDGKLFILEDKATTPVERKKKEPLATHRIDIDSLQLDWYCDEVEPTNHLPVFYVLPRPPWRGPSTGSRVLPDQAVCRVTSPDGPFEDWAFAVRCSDLRAYLNNATWFETHELPIRTATTLREFLNRIRVCELGSIVRGAGGPAKAAASGTPPEPRDETLARVSAEVDQRSGSALAVFVPASDLPNFA